MSNQNKWQELRQLIFLAKIPLVTSFLITALAYSQEISHAQLVDPVRLQSNTPITQSITSESVDEYILELSVGKAQRLTVEQSGIDLVIRVYSPSGQLIREVDEQYADSNEDVIIAPRESGLYKIQILPYEQTGGSGQYTIQFTSLADLLAEALSQLDAASGGQTDGSFSEDPFLLIPGQTVDQEWTFSSESFPEYSIQVTEGQYVHLVVDYQGIIPTGILHESPPSSEETQSCIENADALLAGNQVVYTPSEVFSTIAICWAQESISTAIASPARLDRIVEFVAPNRQAIEFIAEYTGIYKFQLIPVIPVSEGEGRYQIRIEEIREASVQDQRRIEARFLANQKTQEGNSQRQIGTEESLQKGIEILQEALALWREVDSDWWQMSVLGDIGKSYQALGDSRSALDAYQQALLHAKALGADHEAAVHYEIAGVQSTLADYESALASYQQALQHWQADYYRDQRATTLCAMSSLYIRVGQPEQADNARQGAEELGKRCGTPNTSRQRPDVERFSAYSHSLASISQKSIPIAANDVRQKTDRQTGSCDIPDSSNPDDRILNLQSHAPLFASQGWTLKAIACYNELLEIGQVADNQQIQAQAYTGLGLISASQSDYQQALSQFQNALTLWQRLENPNLEQQAELFYNIGLLYAVLGDHEQAIEQYKQALDVWERLENVEGQAKTHSAMGVSHNAEEDFASAREAFEKSRSLWSMVSVREPGQTALEDLSNSIDQAFGNLSINNLDDVLTNTTNFGDSLWQAYRNRNSELGTLVNLGLIYLLEGQSSDQEEMALAAYDKALSTYNEALVGFRAGNDSRGTASALNGIGRAYSLKQQFSQAIQSYSEALVIWRTIGDRNGEATTLSNIGLLYENQGNSAEAIEYYQQFINITESIQGEIKLEELKSSFASEQVNTYSRLINVLAEQGDFTGAFDYAERARARAFLDQLANGQIDFRAGADTQLLQNEQILRNQIEAIQDQLITLENRPRNQQDNEAIAATTARLDTAQEEYTDLLRQIRLQSPATASLITVDTVPLEELQSLLEPDTTLVEYFVTDDRTFAFILTRDSFNAIPIEVTQAELKEQVELFRDFADLSEVHPIASQQLHKWLIAPLQPYLSTDRLIVVPHGILHYLPFTALTDGNQYLSQDYVLSLLPSANVLRYLPQHHAAPETTLLALGNPTIPDRQLTPLDYAQSEVETIASLFNTQALVGSAATEDIVWADAGRANILHLAVHGEYNPINPLFSTLHLASTSQQDGRLEVHEIYGLDLADSTNLVVLSACQTNIGELSQGDEIVGLNRAFLYAGTPVVMASLWNVDDATTGVLMEQFYTHFKAGMSAAEALRQAQQTVRAEYPHPYFWAAFSITGKSGESVR